MTLDHDSGGLTGQIVAGPNAGHSLDEFDLPQLAAMFTGFDAESVALLESYLDRRFPAWRQNSQRNTAARPNRPATRPPRPDHAAPPIPPPQPPARPHNTRR